MGEDGMSNKVPADTAESFPGWAASCPRNYGLFCAALATAGEKMRRVGLSDRQWRDVSTILGIMAAEAWTAGQSSVEEAREHGFRFDLIGGSPS